MTQIEKSAPSNVSNQDARKQEGKYAALPGAEKGKVVVRFPPEASGYLHIGHAKAALLNQYYQLEWDGKLIFRFDDTNPEKEKEDFEDVIREDVKMLQIKPDICSYTSDYFDLYLDMIEMLIKKGNAYVDDTPADVMKSERESRTESVNRKNSVEKNMSLWEEMKKGTEIGLKCCVRAKIDMQSDNGCMRDPAFYRCKKQSHPRTKDKYCVYPTYDFACPIIDSIEGVTHALRTTEYVDRDVQYQWVLNALELRNKPIIISYSRLNLLNTVLSKRKLTWFVENGVVEGWDDPRMPTVRGVLRRGMTVEGLKQFIMSQGSSRAAVYMEWDKIWSFNKKVIDANAPRFAAVGIDSIPVEVVDGPEKSFVNVAIHPKNVELGQRPVNISKILRIDSIDAQSIKEGESVTFVNWGNLIITQISKDSKGDIVGIKAKLNLDDKDFKKTYKTTWVTTPFATRATFVYYDHLIAKALMAKEDDFKDYMNKDSKFEIDMLAEEPISKLKRGEVIQVLRKGFFICDEPESDKKPARLISIPDGSTDLNIFPAKVRTWKEKNMKIAATFDAKKPIQTKHVGAPASLDVNVILKEIKQVGDEIRLLKSSKADKSVIDGKVKVLIASKTKFKEIAGRDWTPSDVPSTAAPPQSAAVSSNSGDDAAKLDQQVRDQGDRIRELKAAKKSKEELQPEIDKLISLKADYKKQTGNDWQPPAGSVPTRTSQPSKPKEAPKSDKKSDKQKQTKQQTDVARPSDDGGQKKTLLGLQTKKSENFADWYTEVITKSEMIEYYDISGCYILRPWSYAIWEFIQSFLDKKFKAEGVRNCYFPMFVTEAALEKEKAHIADFAPEVAWVTKSGQSDLPEPIAIRPTSETVMYPSFAKWVQSYRDLPIRINQWCNIVRWEFKNPTPFLRTREFLWQEGHSAWADKDEAVKEVYTMLDAYAAAYEELLAVPVIKGRKTEKEKFPGGDFTTTIEGFIPMNGRGIQAATSHHLGQNFSKMFEIVFEDPEKLGEKKYAYQNSYGFTTRSIGTMIMVHSDDKGLVLPPRVAGVQAIITPCGLTVNTKEDERKTLLEACGSLLKQLIAADIRAETDFRDHVSPGWKYNHWELKGVPIRIELGPKDLQKNQLIAVRRDQGTKISIPLNGAANQIEALLEDIQSTLFRNAKTEFHSAVIQAYTWNDFVSHLNNKKLLLSPFCGIPDCEDMIKKESTVEDPTIAGGGQLMGAKSLCIPLEQPKESVTNQKCINPNCKNAPKYFTLFGRSY